MKRSIDDDDASRPPKRQAGEGYGEDRRGGLTTGDALGYLREVKNRFANNRKVYDRYDTE